MNVIFATLLPVIDEYMVIVVYHTNDVSLKDLLPFIRQRGYASLSLETIFTMTYKTVFLVQSMFGKNTLQIRIYIHAGLRLGYSSIADYSCCLYER